MKIVVGVASAVAGEDAEDHVEADADTEDDDVRDVCLQAVPVNHQHDDKDDQLDEEVKQVYQDHAFLSLAMRILLISCF